MPEKMETRVSLSLDPGTWTGIEGYNDETKQFVGCVVNAVADAHHALAQIHDARRLADGNGAWTEDQKLLNVGQFADKHKLRILKKMDLADRDLTASIGHTEKLLSEPLTQQAGLGSLNGEVRSFVRGLDRPKREAFIREALDSDDEATLTAILGGQHFLSGLTKLDHDHYLRLYHTKKNPHLVVRLDVMKRFRDRLGALGPILHAQFQRAVGTHPNVVAHLARADEQARAALKIEPMV